MVLVQVVELRIVFILEISLVLKVLASKLASSVETVRKLSMCKGKV